MIIVQLNGGLGNQFFQYALGRRLAVQNNVPLKLDISIFKHYTLHPYRLQPFKITGTIASNEEIQSLKDEPGRGVISKIHQIFAGRRTDINKSTHIRERSMSFDPDILNAPPDVYLEGYWASERYFKDIEQIIREEFTVKEEMDKPNRELAAIISETDAISLHVRRGDFISNPVTNEFHGTCSLDYYHRAIAQLTKTVERPHLFIFSDDPEWVRDNLHLSYPSTQVTINDPDKGYMDLRLMSLCKHHIIANSTFSWWGAWLSTFPDKQVYAPEKWFNKADMNSNDLIPESWIRI